MSEDHQPNEAAESELLAVRRGKLDALRADGVDPFPPRFPGVATIASVRAQHADLADGAETDDAYRVAGRIVQRRGQGKMAFLDLVDRSGRIQLQARLDVLGEQKMDRLLGHVDLGDLLGIDGTVFSSRRGELTLRIDDFTVLAKSLRPPPDKHAGLQDIETKFRHRELDLMASEESRALFVARAAIIAELRRYLDEDGFIEVETPILQPLYGGAAARPFTTHHNELGRDLYLRIATELYLKRLIVGGLERVYEIGKNFRNEGVSHKHNPEFTAVEWYEAYADYEDVMARVQALMPRLAAAAGYDGEIDWSTFTRVSFVGSIKEVTGIDVMAHDAAGLARAVAEWGGIEVGVESWPALADALFSKAVEPSLIQPTFVVDYPKQLSPFAKDKPGEPGIVERFEAFAGGMEFANAFTELNDPDEQRERFEAQVRFAEEGDDEAQPFDESFIFALEHGMPPTGGIGIGIDRLVVMLLGQHSIREVLLFPAMRS
jgi:lysyl-tRNA synthetase class 2